jgi:transcriptional regulator with XRE-family HTH domain
MAEQTLDAPDSSSGEVLRQWRKTRKLSQIELSTSAYVAQRDLSRIETQRIVPSQRTMVHLADALDMPLRERNDWLKIAGHEELYSEHDLNDAAMDHVRHVFDMWLRAQEPFPAYVMDRAWNLMVINEVGQRLISRLRPPQKAHLVQGNLMQILLHPDGIRDRIVNWPAVAASMLHRLNREIAHNPNDPVLVGLLEEVSEYPGLADLPPLAEVPEGGDLLAPIHVRTPLGEIRLFTATTTIETPYDVTLEELRMETLLPADPSSEVVLAKMQR